MRASGLYHRKVRAGDTVLDAVLYSAKEVIVRRVGLYNDRRAFFIGVIYQEVYGVPLEGWFLFWQLDAWDGQLLAWTEIVDINKEIISDGI